MNAVVEFLKETHQDPAALKYAFFFKKHLYLSFENTHF